MPQFGHADVPLDFPSWATAEILARISRHPTKGTARADGRLVMPSDSLGRHQATRHACRIHYEQEPRTPQCPHSADDPPESLILSITDVPWLGGGSPPSYWDGLVLGDFVLTYQRSEGFPCLWRVTNSDQASGAWSDYYVLLWRDFDDPAETLQFRVWFAAGRPSAFGPDIVSYYPHRTAPIPTDEDHKIVLVDQFPLVVSPEQPFDPGFPEWDFENATFSVTIDPAAPPPPVPPPPNYLRSESVWIELRSRGVFEADGFSGTTSRGHNVYWRINWRPNLPISATPGVEHEIVFFRGGVELGRRKMEWPDDVLPWQYDSGLSLSAAVGEVRDPPDDSPLDSGQFFGFESVATSDRWEWWNSHQIADNPNDLAGTSVAVEARISGFRFAGGQEIAWNWSWRRAWFEDLINRRHILAPVTSPDTGRMHPVTLVKHGESIYDPDAGDLFGPAPIWYTYAVVLVFAPTGIAVSLHVRVIRDVANAPPFWEPLPSPLATLVGVGPENGGKVLGATPDSDLRLGGDVLYPLLSRSFDQYELTDIELTDRSPAPHPWLSDFPACRITLAELKNRGDEPPSPGPLENNQMGLNHCLARHDGVARSLGPSGSPIHFGDVVYDTGGWLHGVGDTYLTVPPGVNFIEGAANCDTGSSIHPGSLRIRVNQSEPLAQPKFQEQPDTSNPLRGNICLPPIPVSPGDQVDAYVVKAGVNFSGSVTQNWLYLRAVGVPQVLPISGHVANYGEPVPPIATIRYLGTVPPVADGFALSGVMATLLTSKSPADDISVQVSVIRAATRAIDDLLINSLTIDADHWSSETSVAPAVINPATATVQAGDQVIATMLAAGVGGEGLSIGAEFTEPT